ncbi:hypothetical protein GGS20DRAFT_594393 [Poronia punctata]|nr:hypothetical protein GGS20DRAFT_594393 [Poronia punctata]
MRSNSIVAAVFGAVSLCLNLANAERACGSSSNSTSSYLWHVGDARYDGVAPESDGNAVVAVSIIPNNTNSFFECVAEWPESWAGWSGTKRDIIWSDCIWSGAGPTYDTTISFALDWENRTMYLAHTFACSDKEGLSTMATGSFELGLNCTEDEDETTHCTLNTKTTSPSLQVKTVASPPRLSDNASCSDNGKVYQSWQVENWQRQYKLIPGDTESPPSEDTGPSFTLESLANGGVFECAPTVNVTETGVFDGACKQTTGVGVGAGAAANSTAAFQFDPLLDILSITQDWECGTASSFGTSGVGFVQASCSRQGQILTCSSVPFWIGTEPL